MKRFAMFLGGLLILPAFGEVAPVFYDDYDIEYVDTDYADQDYIDADDSLLNEEDAQNAEKPAKTPVKVSRQQTVSRNIANRSSASRATPSSQSSSTTSGRGNSTGNSARAVAARTTTAASPRANASRAVSSRTATTGATRAAATRATGGTRVGTTTRTGKVASGTKKTTSAARTATATNGARVSRASTTSARIKNITGSGTTLYNGFDSGTGRVGVRSSSSMRRSPVVSVTSNGGLATEETGIVASDTSEMDELAELTDYCKAQYMACMDNYCNVLDENQGRCSCSANLKNYAKSEAALKQATEELQDVAQKIQYIGLSAREVETLFTQTEAEQTMQSKTDNSQLKTSLDKVKDMIIEARSGNATSTSSGMSFDLSGLLDFTIDSTGFDLSSFLGGLTGSGNNVSNQRGAELFKTATNRCKANVLRACTAQGVDASTITNAYDLEIDKECIAYEKSLNQSNDEMASTVRNAKSVLQKARLMVAQSKNEYDMRGCINALDACMQDEFVCGSDYENCLDPTGRYIVNGEIVVGSQPGHAIDPSLPEVVGSVMTSDVCDINLYRTWDFSTGSCNGYGSTYQAPSPQNNAWGAGENDTLANYIEQTVTQTSAKNASVNMSEYLQNKIGYVDDSNRNNRKNFGMCIGVLNKCQDYTYTGTGNNTSYNPQNDVIKQYLGRVLIQIKSKQDEVLNEYAESCITDVQSCLSQNGYPTEEPLDDTGISQWTGTEQTQANIAINACRATIVTCMSVNGFSISVPTPNEMNCWVMGLQFDTMTEECLDLQAQGSAGTASSGNGGVCSSINLSACTPSTCAQLTGNYAWCSATSDCRLSSQCSSSSYSHTVTYKCGSGATGNDWPQTVTGTSNSISLTWASGTVVNNHCSYSGYTAKEFNCKRDGSSTGTTQQFGQSTSINTNVTCTVVWQANAGNTTCGPSNRSYCDETNCASTGQGVWCYASRTAQEKSCMAVGHCACNAGDTTACTSGSSCLALGNSYHYCTTGGKATCNTSSTGCCYVGSINGSVAAACNAQSLCETVGNVWCNDACHPAGHPCSNSEQPAVDKGTQWSDPIEAPDGTTFILGGSENN